MTSCLLWQVELTAGVSVAVSEQLSTLPPSQPLSTQEVAALVDIAGQLVVVAGGNVEVNAADTTAHLLSCCCSSQRVC